MDLALLGNMSIILITAVIVLLVFNKLKLPTMIGLFFTGIVLGHYSLSVLSFQSRNFHQSSTMLS